MNKIDRIISETIDKYMLKEYKNPNDSEAIRVCADQLEALHDNMIANGANRHEYTLVKLANIIGELRKIQNWIR